MSFDANILSSKPVIKAAASMQNDGGGGNLGYMSQGRKKKEEKEKKYLEGVILLRHEENDMFGFKEPEMPEEQSLISKIVNTVKELFIKK